MKLLIVYASQEGQTAKIAHHVENYLTELVDTVEVAEVSAIPPNFAVASYDAVMVAAPIYAQHHLPGVSEFVKTHRETLRLIPTVFVSVSLAAADLKLKTNQALKQLVDLFLEEIEWEPTRIELVAGSLVYSHYSLLKRFMLYWIMRRAGVRTKTSQDYEYTDWEEVEAVAMRFFEVAQSERTTPV
jgi:menaquinone-dependent protoporphyrinogen oxidase